MYKDGETGKTYYIGRRYTYAGMVI